MGQKVHPKSFRLGVNKSWSSRWFSKKDYAHLLHRDITLRAAIKERLKDSGISQVEIERSRGSVKINIFTSKPGIIIGRQGAAIEDLRQELTHRFGETIEINIVEVRKPDIEAQLIAENIADQISRRLPYRRASKQALIRGMEGGLIGVKIRVAGRLNGSDIARDETFKEGNIPLHTLRSDVDFGTATARTTYGAIGIKVWTYKGAIFAGDTTSKQAENQDWLAESRKGHKAKKDEGAGRLAAELTEKAA
jgi:small subunit ribosomal protein S3